MVQCSADRFINDSVLINKKHRKSESLVINLDGKYHGMGTYNLDALNAAEALKNSPHFKYVIWQLAQHESYLQMYDTKILELLRWTNDMIEKGKAYVDSFQHFLGAFADMNVTCFSHDQTASSSLQMTLALLNEVAKYQKVFVEQIYWSLVKNLEEIRKRDRQTFSAIDLLWIL
ncbi:Arf-GAP with coiled-coil, ANK repeat and PH domain-containing protein 3 [Trichinella nativa]|uniref:Arf-GAP with coiled-coil, ANK repeat and PH domain-containing protein 3 n=1 Tax=Trichinella nativa TaxID=6335 RepID=A0A0V1KVK7_9BILA|nr:Arf-GAP with coiled-coil, ANK repeat and PH domain-containing protein 3 [Trichinella nativa]